MSEKFTQNQKEQPSIKEISQSASESEKMEIAITETELELINILRNQFGTHEALLDVLKKSTEERKQFNEEQERKSLAWQKDPNHTGENPFWRRIPTLENVLRVLEKLKKQREECEHDYEAVSEQIGVRYYICKKCSAYSESTQW